MKATLIITFLALGASAAAIPTPKLEHKGKLSCLTLEINMLTSPKLSLLIPLPISLTLILLVAIHLVCSLYYSFTAA
jgi:hypothetical protein